MTNFHLRKGLGGDAKKSNENSTKATFSTENQQAQNVPVQMFLDEKVLNTGDAPAKWSEPGAQQASRALSLGHLLQEPQDEMRERGVLLPLLPPALAGSQKPSHFCLVGTIPSPSKSLLTVLMSQGH